MPLEPRHLAARFMRAMVLRAGRRLSVAPPGWQALTAELHRWPPGSLKMWWRDDDATADTHALTRLLDLRDRLSIPLALAVIPAVVQPSLAAALCSQEGVSVLVHGWDHIDHSRAGASKAELAAGRDPNQVAEQLSAGRDSLAALFGHRALPVLVPPFNQLAPSLINAVRNAGFTHISVDRDMPGYGIRSVNVHADVVNWNTGTAADTVYIVQALLIALRLRRWRVISPQAPLGIMTHHLAHDAATWALSEELLTRLKSAPSVTFRPIAHIFTG